MLSGTFRGLKESRQTTHTLHLYLIPQLHAAYRSFLCIGVEGPSSIVIVPIFTVIGYPNNLACGLTSHTSSGRVMSWDDRDYTGFDLLIGA